MNELGFWRVAKAYPERTALVGPDGMRYNFAELALRSNQVVHALRALGLEKGDTISVVAPNCVEVIELYLAALQAGWYLTPINNHLVASEIAYIVNDSDSKVFVGHSKFAEECSKATTMTGLESDHLLSIGDITNFGANYHDFTAGFATNEPEQRTAGAVMNYTSGTTGNPKGVRRPLLEIDPDDSAALLTGLQSMFGITAHDDNVHLVGSPLYHTAVLLWAGSSIHMGHTLVIMDKWTPQGSLQLIQDEKVTTSHMVPTQFHRLLSLDEPTRNSFDVTSLRHMVHAAAPCPVETKQRMIDWWGDCIDEYYAATEGGGTMVSAQEWRTKPGTVGKAWPISEVVVLDDQDQEVPVGQIGTIYMHMMGSEFKYYKDDAKTAKARRGKFFTVGDIGYLDDDGFLFLCDRKADMIISGGANIYPAEIESALLQHPDVADVAVFGVPNDDWGEEVKAVIQLNDGLVGHEAKANELMEFCEDRLAKFKRPKSIDFTAEMPRDPNGKLYKRKLRDPYWEGRQRQI